MARTVGGRFRTESGKQLAVATPLMQPYGARSGLGPERTPAVVQRGRPRQTQGGSRAHVLRV